MQIHTSRLSNGVQVIAAPLAHVRSAAIAVGVSAGAHHEPAHLNGVSHFLEHMLFKGTGRRSAADIAREVESVGGDINAYTDTGCTVFHVTALGEHAALALNVLADMVQFPTFDAGEMERERSVILQEIAGDLDDPQTLAGYAFARTAYPHQPAGRPILGTPHSVGALSRDAMAAYHRDHYAAGSVTVVGAGAVDPAALHNLAESLLGNLPAGGGRVPARGAYVGGTALEPGDYEQTYICLGFPGVLRSDARAPALDLFVRAFGCGIASPLYLSVREEMGLSYDVSGFLDDSGAAAFGVAAGVASERAGEFLPAVRSLLERMADNLPSRDLERARMQHRAQLLMAAERPWGLASEVLEDLVSDGRPVSVSERLAQYDAVTPEQVRAVVLEAICQPATVAAVGPPDALVAVAQTLPETARAA